jgi:hypothetical protein
MSSLSTLRRRLGSLERAHGSIRPAPRCDTCRDRPAMQVVYVEGEGIACRKDPEAPIACPDCGWRPIVVRIVEVDDWDRVRRPRR